MNTVEVQYIFTSNPDGSFTIIERIKDPQIFMHGYDLYFNWNIDFPSWEEAQQTVQQIRWLEQICSPPRT